MKDNYIKNTWNMIFYNFKTFMSFEFLFKTLLGLIILPSFIYSFNLLMKVTGTTYITVDNMGEFLWNRVTFSLLFIILIILALIIIFDIATMIVIFDESYHKNKISLGEAIKISYSKCKNIFTFKNILVCFLVLFFMPFLSIGIEANIITSLKIPEFIINFFTHNKDYFIYGIGIYLILIILSFKWIFSLHYMIIEEKSFKNARKYSKELIHKRVLLDIIEIFFGRLVFIIE